MKIVAGDRPLLHGNMRTAWYAYVEPFYVAKNLLESDLGPPLEAMLEELLPEDLQGLLEETAAEIEPGRAWTCSVC